MKDGVLIDRELIENILCILKQEGYAVNTDALQCAISYAPDAVIPTAHKHDCQFCPASVSINGHSAMCNASNDKFTEDISKHIIDNTAPDWCPQITKE